MNIFVLQNQTTGQMHMISGEIVVGREFGWDDGRMSRKHFRISAQDGSAFIEDLGSSNGTMVNSRPLPPGEAVPVRPGDVIQAGDTQILLTVMTSEEAATLGLGEDKPTAGNVGSTSLSGGDRFLKNAGFVLGGLAVLGAIAATVASALLPGQIEKKKEDVRKIEAKALLVSFYSAMNAFHAEHSFYTTDLVAMQLKPEDFADANYKVGFTSPSQHTADDFAAMGGGLNPTIKDTDALGVIYGPRVPNVAFDPAALVACPDCTAERMKFKLIAVGNIDEDDTLDIWTLDEQKKFFHVVDDTEK